MLSLTTTICCLLILAIAPGSEAIFEPSEEQAGKPSCNVLLPSALMASRQRGIESSADLIECVYLNE